MSKVAVVILNWNGREMLETYLPSVCAFSQGDDCRVVVADNGSTDDSVDFLRNHFPSVDVLPLDKNYGFAEGYNLALSQIEAEYFVLLNSDVEVTENWLAPMVDYLDAHPDVAACQPKIRAVKNPRYFEHAGACGGFIDRYGFPFCRGRVMANVEEDNGQYDNVIDIFWATGAALFVRSSDFRSVGGLDGTFFAHMEEIDLCWRLRSRGRRIVCLPQSLVYHVGGATLSVENPRKTYLNFRNNLLMIYKNESEERLSAVLRMRWLFDNVAALQYLLKGDRANYKAIKDARREFRRIRAQYDAKRRENLDKSVVSTIKERAVGSIVVGYYLLRKRLFTDYFGS